ncbi:30S ribosomal mitochondrial [Chlorella sorokiniana]|jgi:ribosomal small subunit protein bTHX|uniref:30S ribosomal mitochondrial n=1 Tax=Chlorella sorokiniana TaxID=3076 RepID=A0A2P6TEZ1_CHLSO|nr:30S ribosomal mitochondrial [Chlorella sorokiniana]|eukprot:PRW32539.1 30S ribosomal mitochondrial [Chlorella sorokiniana]
MASRQLGSGLLTSLRSWAAVALGGSGGAASSGGWAARLEEALTKPFLGTRDGKTRRGKVFKGSYGKSRPRKARSDNPYMQPQQPAEIPIPYPPGWQPGLAGGAATGVAGALA